MAVGASALTEDAGDRNVARMFNLAWYVALTIAVGVAGSEHACVTHSKQKFVVRWSREREQTHGASATHVGVGVYVGTGHAGCALTRRSTKVLTTMLGRHCVPHASNVQSTIALSSGQSESHGLVRGCAACLGREYGAEGCRSEVFDLCESFRHKSAADFSEFALRLDSIRSAVSSAGTRN